MKTVKVNCKACQQPKNVQFDERGLFSESFVRLTFVGDCCAEKGRQPVPCGKTSTRNPYRDD